MFSAWLTIISSLAAKYPKMFSVFNVKIFFEREVKY
jgi:hypothetical protein